MAITLAYSAELPDGSGGEVLIGTTTTFADSLASGMVQGTLDAPLLLTPPDRLDDRVVAEIQRLDASRAVIFGGTDAISPAVQTRLEELVGRVDRIAGDTRITTAIATADFVYPNSDVRTVILARAYGPDGGDGSAAFADAMAAGAAAAYRAYPVLLTPSDTLDPTVEQYLIDKAVEYVIIAGGTAAISQAIEDQLATIVPRIDRAAGTTRVGTAYAIGGLTRGAGRITAVPAEGPLAWVSGFAAARTSPGGVVLTTGDAVPTVTLDRALGVGDDLRCGIGVATAACARLFAAATIDLHHPPYEAWMDPDQVVPPSLATSSGLATIWPAGEDDLCLGIETYRLSGPVRFAELRQAPFGQDGPASLTFEFGPDEFGPDAADTRTAVSCTLDIPPPTRAQILDAPADFALVLPTPAHPDGEIRGQTFAPQTQPLVSNLYPRLVVPGPGDEAAFAGVELIPTGVPDELCYRMELLDLASPATAMHLHRGQRGDNGPQVAALDTGIGHGLTVHCGRGIDPQLVTELFNNPHAFYIDVHTDAHPDGAIRGELV